MTQQRNIHGWHLLTLVLAFVAGGALTMHLPNFKSKMKSFDSAPALQAKSQQDTNSPGGTAPLGADDPEADIAEFKVAEATGDADAKLDDIPLFLQNEIDDLRFEAERSREEIAELREEVARLSLAEDQSGSPDASAPSAPERFTQRPARAQNNTDHRDALIQAGVTPDLADSIQQRQDQKSLARLELFDRAAREGYSNTERLTEEIEELDAASPSLRQELGDSAYDEYLFNAGRANRVVVDSVINGSNADISGVQVGDIIFSYASRRIFTQQGLRAATQEGVRDEPIVLELVRDQQTVTLDAIRGPLGISMTPLSVSP